MPHRMMLLKDDAIVRIYGQFTRCIYAIVEVKYLLKLDLKPPAI